MGVIEEIRENVQCFMYLPSIRQNHNAQNRCLPDNEFMHITEISAEIKLQQLLNHTIERILLSPDVKNIENLQILNLELVTKWGFDGTSGRANYKQVFKNSDGDDSSVSITSLVPLKLHISGLPNQVIWINNRPSSTRLCRPIRLQFAKENKEITIKEKADLEKQIANLVPSEVNIHELKLTINHKLVCSMIDGKVCSALTGIGSQRCFICGASPKQFNQIEEMIERSVNRQTFDFGLRPLHAKIRYIK